MKAIIFDTETTGIDEPSLVQAACIYMKIIEDGIQTGSVRSQFFKPSKPIEFGAMAVHHITNEMVEDCDLAETFVLPECSYLIGHNIDFDWNVIGCPEIKRICTLALSRKLWPEASHSQMALLYMLDQDVAVSWGGQAHKADADVSMLAVILKHIVAALGVQTIDELYNESELARIPTHMPFGKHKGVALCDVPSDYFGWLLRQPDVDPYLRKAIGGL